MMRLVFGVVAMGALATACGAAVAERAPRREAIPAFRFEKDRYNVQNGAKGAWREDRAYEVTVPKQNFWMYFQAFPGMKPFRGAESVTLVTDVAYPAEIAIHIREFPHGKNQKFKSYNWRERTTFETKLDPAKTYQLECIEIYRSKWDKKPWRVAFLGLEGVFSGDGADAVEVTVETGNPLHIVRAGRNERPVLVLANKLNTPVALSGTLEMKGFSGEARPIRVETTLAGFERQTIPIAEEGGGRGATALPVRAGAEEGGGRGATALPVRAGAEEDGGRGSTALPKGVWRIGGALKTGDGSVIKVETRFAVMDEHHATPKQPKGTYRLGINYHMGRFTPEDKRLTIAALNACGAKLVRASVGISMQSVQRKGPDSWDFSEADHNLELLEDAGLAVDSSVFSIPNWAAYPERRTNRNWHVWCEGRPMPGLLERYCEGLARRYGTRIDYYETGNEWDLGFTGTIDEAVEIQGEVYRGLKKGCPEVCVIPNGWAQSGNTEQVVRSGHRDFQETFLGRAGDFFDVHPIHIHGSFSAYANEIEGKFFPMRERAGVAKKPWYSNETAITSTWGERTTALTVWKKILYAWSMGSTDYVWYNLKGTGWDPKDVEQGYGLITADYYPREGFVAFAALATTVGGKRFTRTVFRKASRFVLEFADARERALCAWDEAATQPAQVAVKTDAARVWQVDLMGNRTSVAMTNGCATFAFGATPAALVMKGATFSEPDPAALADIPPPKAKAILIPRHAAGRKPDFTLDRQKQVKNFFEANPAEIGRLWKGPQDQSAKVWLVREKEGLRVLAEVTDDVHAQPYRGGDQYMGDDIQVALASHLQNGHWEIGLARRDDGGSAVHCWLAPNGFAAEKAASCVALKTSREGSVTRYDAFLPYAAIGFSEKLLLQGVRFNLLVNDNDGTGRDAYIEIKPENFASKDASTYPFVRFVK